MASKVRESELNMAVGWRFEYYITIFFFTFSNQVWNASWRFLYKTNIYFPVISAVASTVNPLFFNMTLTRSSGGPSSASSADCSSPILLWNKINQELNC